MDNSVIVSLRDIVVEFDGQRILDGLNLDIHDIRNIVQLFCPVIAYHKQSELKCQSLCRGLPKLYIRRKKIPRCTKNSHSAGVKRFILLSADPPDTKVRLPHWHPPYKRSCRLPPSGNSRLCPWHRSDLLCHRLW